jgi:uncharacterized membrane protein
MANQRKRVWQWWVNYGAYVLAAGFCVVSATLLCQKHDAFNTRTYDLARFDQAIWNTLHGRFLFSTIGNHSVLGNHFSPLMALLSPLFLIWNDVKVLFLVQVVSVAVTGLVLYRMVRLKHPFLATSFLLAFYLNPAVHDVTLFEFRRVVPAMPFLAMALYALYARKRWWMVLGLGLALLCKENVGFIVCMVGVYLTLFERDWKWGLPLMVVGAAWVILVSLWVIPAFAPPTEDSGVYPQLYYFQSLGDSYEDILTNVLRDPLILVRQVFDLERLRALGRVFAPLGLVLPFLAPDWALICLPTMAYMLLSDDPRLYRFEAWRLATVLPVLFAAVAVGLGRLPRRRASWLTALLMGTTVVGFSLFSPAPLGGTYDAALYDVTEHHRLAAEIVKAVPADASVATQARYVPHLSHREHIYHYPWIVIGVEDTDCILLDRHSNPYPFSEDELDQKITDIVTDPTYEIVLEADGIYLFRRQRTLPIDRVVDDSMRLESAQITVQGENGLFSQPSHPPVQVHRGQQVRVTLLWEALAAPEAERTVSVRLVSAGGGLITQQDNWPGQGAKPTSWWEAGWRIRDVYYLTVPPDAQDGSASLHVLVYDSYSHDVISLDDGTDSVEISSVEIVH